MLLNLLDYWINQSNQTYFVLTSKHGREEFKLIITVKIFFTISNKNHIIHSCDD